MNWNTAIVTGASSGIGRELARQLAAGGCRVGLLARRRESLDETVASIHRDGGQAMAATCDVTSPDDLVRAVGEVRASYGPIDLLIANAGVGMPTFLEPMNLADIRQMFEVNVLGVVWSFAAVLPEMLARRSGHLAAVSSLGAGVALPGESAYCSSKAALNVYLDGLRMHLCNRGVRVTSLRPGFVRTGMIADFNFPMPGLMDASTAAERMVSALRRGKKNYAFPLITCLTTRFLRMLPDAWIVRLTQSYVDDLTRLAAKAGRGTEKIA